VERVRHIRNLLRQRKPTDEAEQVLFARHEQKTKDFLSNIRRSSDRPMLNIIRAIGEICSLTTDGSHRLFGYEIDDVRRLDAEFNGPRTHIVESYIFERDVLVDLPLELAPPAAFARTATVDTLVKRWQNDIPIRFLNTRGWKRSGTFYVRVGVEDSLGSSIPPGSIAVVEPITHAEVQLPNPRHIYLLQFVNGYRCRRCVVSAGKLQLLASGRNYSGTEQFSYPGSVRIAGRIRAFSTALPLPDSPSMNSLSKFAGAAEFLLPWEQPSREHFFATEHRRFVRSSEEMHYVSGSLQKELHSKLSERTRRRYRHETDSEPHVDALIQMSIEHYSAYSDTLRTGGYPLRDKHRFSLEAMLEARHIDDLLSLRVRPKIPMPLDVWRARLDEFVEWPALLSAELPQLSRWSKRVIRIAGDSSFPKLDPPLRTGAFMLTQELPFEVELRQDSRRSGWSRPLYALSREPEIFIGHIDAHADTYTLVRDRDVKSSNIHLKPDELARLRLVCGALVPL
jgi:hypothetical protein